MTREYAIAFVLVCVGFVCLGIAVGLVVPPR